MKEYQLVDTPVIFPARCFCGSSFGKQVDTFIELAGLRIYVCESCAFRCARHFGFTEIAEHEQLVEATAKLEELEGQLLRKSRLLEIQAGELASATHELLTQRASEQPEPEPAMAGPDPRD